MVFMSTNNKPRTEAVKNANGAPIYVGDGAVAQDGNLKLYRCTGCGDEVVWAKSNRTGRHYLVNVTRGYHDQRFYSKRNAHDCGARLAAHAEYAAHAAHAAATRDWVAKVHEIKAAHERGEATLDEVLAAVNNAPANEGA